MIRYLYYRKWCQKLANLAVMRREAFFATSAVSLLSCCQICLANNSSSNNDTMFEKIWGQPAQTSLYLGMATLHLSPSSNSTNWNNQLVGVTYNGYFAGTLKNSYSDRAYIIGIQRCVYTQPITENLNSHLGYRLGLISGYDERLNSIAEHVPFLPVPQLLYDMTWHKTGIEWGLGLGTLSVAFFIHFD